MLQIANKSNHYYSPLRYPGGKACLSQFMTDIIDWNSLNESTYCEPYAGGAGAALTLLALEKIEKIIINDLDIAIYSFWKSVIDDTEKFIAKLGKIDLSMNEWHRQREIYRSKTEDTFKLGFATFYLNRTNRSGIIEGGPIGGIDQTGSWSIDARFNREGLIERIKKIGLYRKRIKVSNRDGISLIKTLSSKEKIFVYLDPPYYVKGGSLYLNHYQHSNHRKLSRILNANPSMNWLLTYDNVPEIAELYEGRNRYEFCLNYHANKPKKGQELLIISDSIKLSDIYRDHTPN